VPSSLDLTLDLDPSFTYTASSAVDEISLHATIDETDNGMADGTEVTFLFQGLPSSVNFTLDAGAKHAALTMNDSVDLIFAKLESEDSRGIFGTDYRLIQAAANDIPAHWSVDWAGDDFVLEAKDASNNPAPMGTLAATISTSNDPTVNADKIHPFEISGPGGARIHYSSFLQTIDDRYYNATPGGGAATLAALNALYNNAQVLDSGEDHVVAVFSGGSLDFADLQFTGFQKVAYQPDSDGGHFELDAPSPGLHPLFAGIMLDSDLLALQIDNIPDRAVLDIDLAAHDIHFFTTDDVSATAGNIDFYWGPAGMAQNDQTALRAVMQDTPNDVHIFWNFGFPSGSANFVASNEFTVLFLHQDGSDRFVAGARLQELQAGYNVAFDPHFSVGTFAYVPTSLDLILLTATAGIDNDVNFDGDGNPIIAANGSKPGVDGFFSLYSLTGSPDALMEPGSDTNFDPVGPAPEATEYVPKLSILMKDFREFSLELSVGVHIFGFSGFLDPFIDLDIDVDFDNFVVDFWAGHIDLFIDADPLGEFGYFNAADYRNNTPIHLVPIGTIDFDNLFSEVYTFVGFHHFGDHIDPLA
jgi:hypothetical protein